MEYPSLSEIDKIYALQQKNTAGIKQLPASKREQLLRKLLAKIKEVENEIQAALYQDFHKSALESTITEILAVEMELKHIIKNIGKMDEG